MSILSTLSSYVLPSDPQDRVVTGGRKFEHARQTYLDSVAKADRYNAVTELLNFIVAPLSALLIASAASEFTAAGGFAAGTAAFTTVLGSPLVMGIFAASLLIVGANIVMNYNAARIQQALEFDTNELSAELTATSVVKELQKAKAIPTSCEYEQNQRADGQKWSNVVQNNTQPAIQSGITHH